MWHCSKGGHKHGHIEEHVCGLGVLEGTTPALWPAIMHLIILLRTNERWSLIEHELKEAYGIDDHHTLRTWRYRYQTYLKEGLLKKGALKVGGNGVTVVFDETIVGVHKGVHTGSLRKRATSQRKGAVRRRILGREPARTIHRAAYKKFIKQNKDKGQMNPSIQKKPSMQKKPAMMNKNGQGSGFAT